MFEYREVAAPYPGLRPFEPHETEIFFGRDGHTNRLLEILQREHFLAVIGPSGCGKSSLVRAGLLPGLASGALGTGSHWRLALLRPGGQPLLALAQALLNPNALGRELLGDRPQPTDAGDISPEAAMLAAELRRGPASLAELLQTASARATVPFNLLVLVDQFEEIFTYAQTVSSDDEAETFIDLLLANRGPESRIYVVLTMRTDFLGNCVRFLDLPEAINRAQYLTPRLSPQQMADAITGPARVFDGAVDAGLVKPLLDAIASDSDQLPILQHALARMWREAETKNPTAPLIDAACAEAIVSDVEEDPADAATGGNPLRRLAQKLIAHALDEHAKQVMGGLSPAQQALAETLFRAITERRESGGQEVRRPQSLAAIAEWAGVSPAELKPVIEAFAAPEVSFVQYGETLADNSVIDLSHEALIRQWKQLKDWVVDEQRRGLGYQRWSQRAADWPDKDGLLSGGELARALDWWNPTASTTAPPASPPPPGEGEGPAKPPLPLGEGWGEGQAKPPLPPGEGWSEGNKWQPTPHWASRYSQAQGEALAQAFEHTRQCLIESRAAEQRKQKELEEQAEAERRRADKERRLAEDARANAERAAAAERRLTQNLFASQLTHGSLLARVEDYVEALKVLKDSVRLDTDIAEARRHARNLLAGYADLMAGRADKVYNGAGAALSGGVAVSPDGKLLAAAGERGTLVLFDAETGRLLRRLEGHDPKVSGTNGSVKSIVFDPQGRWLFSGGEDGRIIRWGLPEGNKLGEWRAPAKVWALALSPDGNILASGGTDNKITLWSVAEGKPIRTLEGHAGSIATPNGLVFSADGQRLASAAYDRTARIWDWRTGKSLLTLQGHGDIVHAALFSPDGKLLATSGSDKQIILWDTTSGQPLRPLRGHQNIVFGLAFSADGRQLLSASRDNTLRLWGVDSGITLHLYQGHESGLWSVKLHGHQIYTAANDATVRRWTLDTPQQWLWETGGSPQAAALAPNGRFLALGLADGRLSLRTLPTGEVQAEAAEAHGAGGIKRIAFNPEGSLLATAGMDGQAKLWRVDADGKSLTLLHTLQGHHDALHAVTFAADGKRVATAGYDGQIGLFDVSNGQGRLFAAHDGKVESIAFSPDGKRLLSAGYEDRRLRLWRLDQFGQAPADIAEAQDYLLWASLSPDGREIAAVGREIVVSLYDLDQPGTPRRLVGHEQTVLRALYSPDGQQLATVGGDMTVRVWDLGNQHLLFTLRLPTGFQYPSPLWDFDFRCIANDCWIAVPLTVGRVAVYRLPYAQPPAVIQ